MAEANRVRVAALFAANTDLEVGTLRTAPGDSHLDELAKALDIEDFERIVLQNALIVVHRQELVFRIFTRKLEYRLGHIIRTEGEELRAGREFRGPRARAHGLDHGAEFVPQRLSRFTLESRCRFFDRDLDPLQFL